MDMKSNTLQMYIRFFIISPPSFWLEADTQSKYPYILYKRKKYKTPLKKIKKLEIISSFYHLIGLILFFIKKLFVLEKGLLPKNPFLAEKGDG